MLLKITTLWRVKNGLKILNFNNVLISNTSLGGAVYTKIAPALPKEKTGIAADNVMEWCGLVCEACIGTDNAMEWK